MGTSYKICRGFFVCFFNVSFIIFKRVVYYKIGRLLQNGKFITKWAASCYKVGTSYKMGSFKAPNRRRGLNQHF